MDYGLRRSHGNASRSLESYITTLSQRKKTHYLVYTDASTEEGCGGMISELLGDDLEGESEEI